MCIRDRRGTPPCRSRWCCGRFRAIPRAKWAWIPQTPCECHNLRWRVTGSSVVSKLVTWGPSSIQCVLRIGSSHHWLGRRGPLEWPARSRDLTPCDFFLWGLAKEEIYRRRPQTLPDLENKIRNVLTSVPHEFFLKSVDGIPQWLRTLKKRKGAHIEFWKNHFYLPFPLE